MSGNTSRGQGHDEEREESSRYPAVGFGLGLGMIPQHATLLPSHYPTSCAQPPTGSSYTTADFSPSEMRSTTMQPEIQAFSPQSGAHDDVVVIYLSSTEDFLSSPTASVTASFSGMLCPATVQLVASSSGLDVHQYAITFKVPRLQQSGARMPIICPIALNVEYSHDGSNKHIPVGAFSLQPSDAGLGVDSKSPNPEFTSALQREASLNPESASKRRLSHHAGLPGSAARARSSSYTQPLLYQGFPSVPHPTNVQMPRHQMYGPIQNAQHFEQLKRSSSVPSPGKLGQEREMRTVGHSHPHPTNRDQGSPETISSHPRRSPSSTPGHSGSPNPPLVRTSTLASVSSSSSAIGGSSLAGSPGPSSQRTNSFFAYASKALLKIEGDLDGMTEHWTGEEKAVNRRLVEFKRSQSGNTITATFKPVTLDQRAPNSICVSCIWWEEKDDCFVTSVDTIQLLESLVGVRFTVEEKNRIRRNLEGFRPLTVAKGKPESEHFFKIIMDFPNPKPRNIEKDVKVFPWRILANALKKIIGKYSTSYASATSSLHPSSAIGASNTSPSRGPSRYSASPLSQSSSTLSGTQGPSSTASAHSPYSSHTTPSDPNSAYNRPQSYSAMSSTPTQTPTPLQYMSYGPVGYAWPSQEQSRVGYDQAQQQYPPSGPWVPQYNLDGSPVVAGPPQFAPAQQTMNLSLQQRPDSRATPGYDQYYTYRTQPE